MSRARHTQHDPSRLFHQPPYHRHFSDKTALNIREKEFDGPDRPQRYYFGDDHDTVCGYHKHAAVKEEKPAVKEGPRHDRRLLELEIARLERQYAEARQRHDKLKYKGVD